MYSTFRTASQDDRYFHGITNLPDLNAKHDSGGNKCFSNLLVGSTSSLGAAFTVGHRIDGGDKAGRG